MGSPLLGVTLPLPPPAPLDTGRPPLDASTVAPPPEAGSPAPTPLERAAGPPPPEFCRLIGRPSLVPGRGSARPPGRPLPAPAPAPPLGPPTPTEAAGTFSPRPRLGGRPAVRDLGRPTSGTMPRDGGRAMLPSPALDSPPPSLPPDIGASCLPAPPRQGRCAECGVPYTDAEFFREASFHEERRDPLPLPRLRGVERGRQKTSGPEVRGRPPREVGRSARGAGSSSWRTCSTWGVTEGSASISLSLPSPRGA
mmetsp:Transcript_17552/g.41337  ORF Transcript_17552/g.41337 Transcript_17552/m.41337 type:complete len:253 (-) Transcript_17552:1219-1977(-)